MADVHRRPDHGDHRDADCPGRLEGHRAVDVRPVHRLRPSRAVQLGIRTPCMPLPELVCGQPRGRSIDYRPDVLLAGIFIFLSLIFNCLLFISFFFLQIVLFFSDMVLGTLRCGSTYPQG